MKQKNKVASETHVIGYIELWRKLSDMTSELMETGHGSYELNFTVHSVIVIQSLYGIAALYIDHQRLSHYNIYIASAAWSIINLVIFCEAAYSVTTQVRKRTPCIINDVVYIFLETQKLEHIKSIILNRF